MLVLAGGQLRTVGEHCQAAAAQRAPAAGLPPREKQRETGCTDRGTEQTVHIERENQKGAGPPGSPRRERRLGREEAKAGAPSTLKGASTSRALGAQRRRPLQGLSPSGRRMGQAGVATGGGAHGGGNEGRPRGPSGRLHVTPPAMVTITQHGCRQEPNGSRRQRTLYPLCHLSP